MPMGFPRGKPCVTVIVGTQWGDEGKGRVSNFETRDAKIVVRSTGGNNAGHTVVRDGEKYALHLVPSSIIDPSIMSVISAGVVINPETLKEEIEELEKRGISITPDNFAISNRAHVTTQLHIDMDEAEEELRGADKVGTTKRGIGPTYEDKAARIGIRMCDLIGSRKELKKKLLRITKFRKLVLWTVRKIFYGEDTLNDMVETLMACGEYLKPYITETSDIIHEAIEKGEKVVLEGAQSTFLDLDWGNYDKVTSSNPTASGTCQGAGVGPTSVKEVIGVMKTYCSRVGNGPFPTEQPDEGVGSTIRELGHEYGTTTGRPRRCGWLDLVMIRYAKRINGLTGLALNHFDTIGKLPEFKVCVGYEYQGKKIYSSVPVDHENCIPIYKTFKGGWEVPEEGIYQIDELGPNAVNFLNFIEEFVGLPVIYVGYGPDAKQTVIRYFHDAT